MILPLLLAAAPALAFNPLETKVTFVAPSGLEFQALCKAARIPCAIEVDAAAAGDPLKRTPLRADDATVSEVMHRAILRYPGHRWRFRKGVLYVTPNEADADTPLDKPLPPGRFEESFDSLRAAFGADAGFCSVPAAPASFGVSAPIVDASTPVAPARKPARTVSFKLGEATPRAVLTESAFRLGAGWFLTRAPGAQGKALYCLDLLDYRG